MAVAGMKNKGELMAVSEKTAAAVESGSFIRKMFERGNELRKKYGEFLLRGTYRADEGLTCPDEGIVAGVYEAGGRRLVALWNDSDQTRGADTIALEGCRIAAWETQEEAGRGRPGSIPPQGVMILIPEEVEK